MFHEHGQNTAVFDPWHDVRFHPHCAAVEIRVFLDGFLLFLWSFSNKRANGAIRGTSPQGEGCANGPQTGGVDAKGRGIIIGVIGRQENSSATENAGGD